MISYEKLRLHINNTATQLNEAISRMPMCRERTIAQAHMDTAMLWLRKLCEDMDKDEVVMDEWPEQEPTAPMYSEDEVRKMVMEARVAERMRMEEGRYMFDERSKPPF